MGSNTPKHIGPVQSSRNTDEVDARELGLKNNLKLSEVNILIDYYKRNDPDNTGLLPEEFNEAAGSFFASGLTIDPKIIFNIFDRGEDGVSGRVTLKEFILGYGILCRGTMEGRLKYLFALYGNLEGDGFLGLEELISALNLMQRIVCEISDYEPSSDEMGNEEQIKAVAIELIESSSDPERNGITYDDFIAQVNDTEVVTNWLENLGSVAGEHLRYIERREIDLIELRMDRQGVLNSDPQNALSTKGNTFQDMKWSESELLASKAESNTSDSQELSKSGTHGTIPLPKRRRIVRRDLIDAERSTENSDSRKLENEGRDIDESIAAKPFVINYENIYFKKVLGRGACATVWECEWLHVPVAVKVFNNGQGEAAGIESLSTANETIRKEIVGDYVEEFWLLLQIRHPNCLLYMGICFEPVVCIITELYSGGSVSNFLHGAHPRKFTPEKALQMISGVAKGMLYLHASSPPILHRDLKASNILIDRMISHCVICDFGLSKQFIAEASRESRKGNNGVGTPYTMAPEVMQGGPYTPSADVYSFGIIMYEMYTGRFPFPNLKPFQLIFKVIQGERPVFHDEDDVPSIIKDLIQRCWAQNPEDRPLFKEIVMILTSEVLSTEISARESSLQVSIEESIKKEDNDHLDISKKLLEESYRGNLEKVSQLIEEGADVSYCDYDKRSALHIGKSNKISFSILHLFLTILFFVDGL